MSNKNQLLIHTKLDDRMSEQIDDNYVNGVYVKADGTEQVEIDPQYVYMTDAAQTRTFQ